MAEIVYNTYAKGVQVGEYDVILPFDKFAELNRGRWNVVDLFNECNIFASLREQPETIHDRGRSWKGVVRFELTIVYDYGEEYNIRASDGIVHTLHSGVDIYAKFKDYSHIDEIREQQQEIAGVVGEEACSKITAESLKEARILIDEATDWDAAEHNIMDIYEGILIRGDKDEHDR